ncbi:MULTISPECIES: hypothetical protein [unclassified Streptomyces]|uniref:hypothetical protein n=1 Tax=unclassified Streptomyces TaxID=2593676 RepID=UPI003702D8E2
MHVRDRAGRAADAPGAYETHVAVGRGTEDERARLEAWADSLVLRGSVLSRRPS